MRCHTGAKVRQKCECLPIELSGVCLIAGGGDASLRILKRDTSIVQSIAYTVLVPLSWTFLGRARMDFRAAYRRAWSCLHGRDLHPPCIR